MTVLKLGAVDFDHRAGIVDKSEENCRQILRRARERVASRRPRYDVMPQDEEQIVKRFVQAAADGNWAELIEALSDDATLVCDGSNVGLGATSVQGVRAVAELVLQQAARWLGDGADRDGLVSESAGDRGVARRRARQRDFHVHWGWRDRFTSRDHLPGAASQSLDRSLNLYWL